MYAIFDKNDNLVAFHEDYDVCETYTMNVYRSTKASLYIRKVKKKKSYILESKDELYLVRYGNTYVQEGYIDYLELVSDDQLTADIRYARDVIYRILERYNLKEKDSKELRKSVLILEKIYNKDASFTPDIEFLKRVKMDYDPYIYNIRL